MSVTRIAMVTKTLKDWVAPSLSATPSFNVFVTIAIRVTDIHPIDATHLQIQFETQPTKSYRIDYRDDLDPGTDWQPLAGTDAAATGSSDIRTIDISTRLHRFYRIVQTN